MEGVVNIDDLRKLAKKRLPKIAYDFIEGGTDDEVGLVTNEQAFRKARIVPRYLVDVSVRDQSTTLFGRTYSSPIGIAPTGLAGLFRHGADLMLAEAARDANVPFIMSGSSTGSIEDLGKLAPDHGWYQLYSAKDQAVSEDLIKRAGDAGLKTLVFTVDVPEGSNRERNTRNGWGRPLKLTWKTKFEALLHPAWMKQWLQHGTPYFSNWAKYAGADATAEKVADLVAYQNRAPMTWKHVERYRELWKGNFVLKGIMHPEDAIRAHSLGVDGIMVSNHGARQLDLAPSPLEVLPAIRDAVGDKIHHLVFEHQHQLAAAAAEMRGRQHARPLLHREGFAGQARLAHQEILGLEDQAVRRNQVAHRADRPDENANPPEEQDGHGLRAISYAWANTRISTAKNVVAASADIFKATLQQLENQLAEAEEQKLARATLTPTLSPIKL